MARAATTGTTVTTSTNCCCCCCRRRPHFPRHLPCLHHYTIGWCCLLDWHETTHRDNFCLSKKLWVKLKYHYIWYKIWEYMAFSPTNFPDFDLQLQGTLLQKWILISVQKCIWTVKPMFYDTADSLHTWLNQACQTKEVGKVIPPVSSMLFKLQLRLVGCLICSTTSVTCQLYGILGIITVPSLVFFVLKILFFKLCLV